MGFLDKLLGLRRKRKNAAGKPNRKPNRKPNATKTANRNKAMAYLSRKGVTSQRNQPLLTYAQRYLTAQLRNANKSLAVASINTRTLAQAMRPIRRNLTPEQASRHKNAQQRLVSNAMENEANIDQMRRQIQGQMNKVKQGKLTNGPFVFFKNANGKPGARKSKAFKEHVERLQKRFVARGRERIVAHLNANLARLQGASNGSMPNSTHNLLIKHKQNVQTQRNKIAQGNMHHFPYKITFGENRLPRMHVDPNHFAERKNIYKGGRISRAQRALHALKKLDVLLKKRKYVNDFLTDYPEFERYFEGLQRTATRLKNLATQQMKHGNKSIMYHGDGHPTTQMVTLTQLFERVYEDLVDDSFNHHQAKRNQLMGNINQALYNDKRFERREVRRLEMIKAIQNVREAIRKMPYSNFFPHMNS